MSIVRTVLALIVAFECMVCCTSTFAQSESGHLPFDVPEGMATDTLIVFAMQSGCDLVFEKPEVANQRTRAVAGNMSPSEALEQMLQGTPLGFILDRESGAYAIVLETKDEPLSNEFPSDGRPLELTITNPENHVTNVMKTNKTVLGKLLAGLTGFVLATHTPVSGQELLDEDVYELSPFEVSVDQEQGYNAETTLAGNRLSTDLRDIGSAVTVVTSEFIKDVGATDNSSLLQYTTGTEVGGIRGNFAGVGDAASLNEDTIRPNQNTRVRGLAAADNTREFFRTDIPWDAYNVERVDLQRGPNSILFGQGSPSGIVNTGLKGAMFTDITKAEFRLGSYGSYRGTLDLNREVVEGEMAIRVIALHDNEKFQQDPAFSKDERVYTAMRWEPEFLNKNGARTIFKMNYESGSIESNNPRFLPPVDAITPWFSELNQATYNQFQAWDHISGRPNHGQLRVNLANGQPNSNYQPYLGIFGYPGNPDAPIYLGNSRDIWALNPTGAFQVGGLNSDGGIDGGIESMIDNKWVSLVGTAQMAINGGLDYASAGLWKNNMITDPSLFDFYNNLIDGDTKEEWQDFDVFNFNATQTFFQDKMGVSVDYNREHYENGQKAILPGEVRLQVDMMSVFGNGSPEAGYDGGVAWSDGSPNPNVGRAFVSSNNAWSNRSSETDRDTLRTTAFIKHDFREGSENWFMKALGVHTLTAMYSKEKFESDSRSWQRYGIFDDSMYDLFGFPTNKFNGSITPLQILYLGDSLLGKSASGAKLPAISGRPVLTGGQLNYFDSTWTGTVSSDPGAPWNNGIYSSDNQYFASTQAENPANYVGWTTRSFDLVDAESSKAARDRLTTTADLRKATTSSQVLAWQAKWLQDSIATTFGWRKDIAKSWATSMTPNSFSHTEDRGSMSAYLNSDAYRLPDVPNRIKVESRSYSTAVHVMDLPYIKELTSALPFEVSLLYNRSTNFKPDASRVDILGEPHPAPSGKTVDKGIRIETRDGRYFLKVNKFITSSYSATSTQINAAAIGNWMQLTQNYANIFEFNLLPWGYDATNPANVGQSTDMEGDDGTWRMRYNHHYFNLPDRTWSDQAIFSSDGNWVVDPALEQSIMDSVRAMQRAIDPRFWQAWGIETFGDFGPSTKEVTYNVPAGFTIVEDNVSEGWEIEFGAEPVKGWRLSANASKTDARRRNVGNANIRELMNTIQSSLRLGKPDGVGALHHYWGSEDVVTSGKNWYDGEGLIGAPGSEWRLSQLIENTTVPELREWRVNVVSNYEFMDGTLEGLNVGAGMRYQSSTILSYPPTGDPQDPTTVGYDFTNPVEGPSETNFDFWMGYQKQLTDKIHWRIQLNVYNAFSGDNDLIPITSQPTGEIAAYRIAPKRSWSITNTFEF